MLYPPRPAAFSHSMLPRTMSEPAIHHDQPVSHTVLLDRLLPAILGVSARLAAAWEASPNSEAVATAFLELYPALESAYMAWVTASGAIMTGVKEAEASPALDRSRRGMSYTELPHLEHQSSPEVDAVYMQRRRSWNPAATIKSRRSSKLQKPMRGGASMPLRPSDIIIMPVQRVMRYELFFRCVSCWPFVCSTTDICDRELCKHADPTTTTHDILRQAILSAQRLARTCDALERI